MDASPEIKQTCLKYDVGAVHKRRRQLREREGSKIGQNCQRIVLKPADMGEGDVKNPEKLSTLFMNGP